MDSFFGIRAVSPQRPLPTTPAGCMVGSGRSGGKDKRNTFARTVPRSFGCSPKLSVRRPVQKSSPVVCPAVS
ncbi:hypothetical protein [Bacteroides fragilis]|uniref:hypothetical protein n=1 Tax=Bacteroides fragilis TaxID=817 RepID=UPI002458FC86|nr:hypothetical protein [Bacteroides fragilis]